MLSAQRGIERLHNTVRALRERKEQVQPAGTAELSHVGALMPYSERFLEAMDDDFNTPQAIAALFDLNKEVNQLLNSGQTLSQGTVAAIDDIYRELGGEILGIIPDDLADEVSSELVEDLMDLILDVREQYREAEEWERADELRDRLADLGIAVDDRPEGTTWRLERGAA
jgi:cysteinyl-tRNA synthetase